MTKPTPTVPHVPIAIPMGFAAQIKALQESQRDQAERLSALEHDNASLQAFKDKTQALVARIEALEQHNAHLNARRKEAVSQLLNLRSLHQEADNAFQVRTLDIQPDDLEGMLCIYGTSITTVMSHHQRILAYLRTRSQVYTAPTPLVQQPIGPTPICYAYPPAYTQAGYCRAHTIPYWCRICGQ
ncbi:uncharacterized protein K460DRAFT_359755 [Cucurbitaria berberidis CBS 394.84]|uniref:Uncharacterized protein n=1 Tax=Cucurbitaria berberidis CBS 394.84 TaxID=1168544 RepID=A0A9P4G9A0_9PLEO|nr:uncharacterized protein K460DRAFT_359755 [Cucurbitaria berberidis CBS 394.84]KAF1841242.1 hypothetical protein K460DRAFT_359755 [Cucurbitaria berberidis CBS 394.84]